MTEDQGAETAKLIVAAIEAAEEVDDAPAVQNPPDKPRLLVENADPDRTVAALRDILSVAGDLYDRGVPVRLAHDQIQGGTVAQVMTPEILVMTAHTACRPYAQKARPDGTTEEKNARLPRNLAVMYLEWRGEWKIPPLNGIASAPMLMANGMIHCTTGYDPVSGMWRENVSDLTALIPMNPTQEEAVAALQLVRAPRRDRHAARE